MSHPAGINLLGHVSTRCGLGVAARNTARLLADRGDTFAVIDVPTASMPTGSDTSLKERYLPPRSRPPYPVNLLHFNPSEVLTHLRMRPSWLRTHDCWNAIVPFWELSQLPPDWLPVMERMDAVLAPTAFIADVVRRSTGRDDDVIHFPQTVYVPDGVSADRARWSMRDGETVFAVSFDPNSDITRKNPWAAIDAYLLARQDLDGTPTRLVIKVNNATTRPAAAHIQRLRDAAARDSSISVIAETLSYRDVLSLYASADVYVSLHRSEGLGLGLLESMMLGTPVIATGYSGNMDFMDETNSLLVDHTLVPVTGAEVGAYAEERIGADQVWAEPDVASAARHMVRLADDPGLRASLAATARATALATQSTPARSEAIDRILERAASGSRGDRLAELEGANPLYWRARWTVGRALRLSGLR